MKLTAETTIRTDRETVWRKSQEPEQHVLWDLRFTEIEYLPKDQPEEPQRFRYTTRIGFGVSIEGWGESVGEAGGQASALQFSSDDPKSLIKAGTGSWTYKPVQDGLQLSTVYDYKVRYGILGWLIDRLAFRPLMIWATRWSFDRLRIWIERGIHPALSFRIWLVKVLARVALALVWIHEGLIPKILFVRPSELDLVAQSGLVLSSPQTTLALLGVFEAIVGTWFLFGRAERLAALGMSLAAVALAILVVAVNPSAWTDPFGGISKSLGPLACGATVWFLSPVVPHAHKGKKR